jgi:hypothetical protein
MKSNRVRLFVFRLVAAALVSMGFAQVSGAGMIGTGAHIQSEARDGHIQKIEALLDREDVARQLVAFGANADFVKARVRNMTDAELLELDGRIDSQVAGGDAIALIGAVFLVLLILELVGVIDIFKKL